MEISIFNHPFITCSRADRYISKEGRSLPKPYSVGMADMRINIHFIIHSSLKPTGARIQWYFLCACLRPISQKQVESQRDKGWAHKINQKKHKFDTRTTNKSAPKKISMPRDLGQRAQDFRERWVRLSSSLETMSNIHQTKSSTVLARTLRRMALRSHDYRFRCDRGMGHHHPLWLLCSRMDRDTDESY